MPSVAFQPHRIKALYFSYPHHRLNLPLPWLFLQALVVAEVFKRREIPACSDEESGEFGLIRLAPREEQPQQCQPSKTWFPGTSEALFFTEIHAYILTYSQKKTWARIVQQVGLEPAPFVYQAKLELRTHTIWSIFLFYKCQPEWSIWRSKRAAGHCDAFHHGVKRVRFLWWPGQQWTASAIVSCLPDPIEQKMWLKRGLLKAFVIQLHLPA